MTNYTPLISSGAALTPQNADWLGGKAANLVALQATGQPVPPFYVITTEAFRLALDRAELSGKIARRLSEVTSASDAALRDMGSEIREWIQTIQLPAELACTIADHEWTRQCTALAVRSSVAGEDEAGHAFAGLHASVLGVRGREAMERAIKEVWASGFNEPALIYRRRMGISLQNVAVAVIVQPMIDARTSGVMFTANPATGNVHELVISSLFGAGEGLMSAGLDADRFVIEKVSLTITSQVVAKSEQFQFDETSEPSLQRVPVSNSLRTQSSLSAAEIESLARTGLAIERHFGRPQDIEFAIDRAGRRFILQTRPITTVAELGPAAGNRLIWDNSNIIESYFGVTSPMTFSFIRRAYTIVYYCFAEVMGISPELVRKNKYTFENMLGLFRGRVFYNLLNWYRLLRLFPGFQYNKQFMESMMGVKEPVELGDGAAPPGFLRRYFVELPALFRLVCRSAWNFCRIRRGVGQFTEHFERCHRHWRAIDFGSKSPHELMALYRMMEDTLLWNWKAPIVNDFFVMVFCGALRRLCKAWCRDESGSLANDLLCGEGNIASAEPTRMLLRLARLANDSPELKQVVTTEPPETLAQRIASDPRFCTFSAEFQRYLELFGARRMNELKLEAPSLREKPGELFQILRHYLKADASIALDSSSVRCREQLIRSQAEARAFRALRRSRGAFRRATVFRWVLNNSRLGVKNREQMRFARTQIYDVLRDMLRAIAHRLVSEQILDDAGDIFYLTLDEIWDYIKGTAVTTDLRGLASLRRKEFESYDSDVASAPDSRFETYGMAYHRNLFKNRGQPTPAQPTNGTFRGTPCSSGAATGAVRVLQTPSPDSLVAGEILVAERTDPGWVPLYPTVAGILIERGSILSHSAIVAREMGIPTIVGIPGLLSRIRTGDQVSMDGSTGTIRVLT
jgi:pyruvate,water dikinase